MSPALLHRVGWLMDFLLISLVLVVILVAELPDKTMFALLVLSTKFSARYVFLGAAVAFVVHVAIAVTAGSLLGLLPETVLKLIVAGLFLIGALLLLRESFQTEAGDGDEPGGTSALPGSARAGISSSFGIIFIGEWGDITQLTTANLAARYDDPVAVGIGAVLGLWCAALVGITVGRTLMKYVSAHLLQRVGAAIFLALALSSMIDALR